MSGNPFYLLDVFAESKYSGNQLAVIRVRDPLSDNDMQRIAREINFSETTFILSDTPRDGGYDVRIFTPGEEVPFAGHPTLGTAYVIRNEILTDRRINPSQSPFSKGGSTDIPPLAKGGQGGFEGDMANDARRDSIEQIILNLKIGQIPVTFGNDAIAWMKQIGPVFGKTLDRAALAPVLGLQLDEIDARFPIEEVSTGLPHILVPLRSLESLKRARVDRDLYFDLIKNAWARPIMIFCPEPHEKKNDISVRMFADAFGIPEDPATGSGNGCLAGYLVKHRYLGKTEIDIRSEQGYEMGRPSLLYLRADETGGKIHVSVGGKSVIIAKGDFV
jgi:trans-2,3-dihydro-3-hydroxyanthranilate isomerase